jgi:NAD(P)-dependent dehydrogenase (short-subunit alcohol dehydrogenase family)
MTLPLSEKVAIVIGASAGIGRAYALALAQAGASVVAAARTLGPPSGEVNNTLAHVVRMGRDLPGHIHAQVCDVTQEVDVARLMDQTAANFGRIDVLVNNAALMEMFYEPLALKCEDWDRMININLRGPYFTIRYAAPYMKEQGTGSIINITAKVAGFIPRSVDWADGTILYGVTKAGLNRLSHFMSEELKPHGIAVNALSPGVVATDTALASNPNLKDYGGKDPTPEVLGPAVVYLAQQSAETLTGQILHTDEFGKSWGLDAAAG